MAFRVCTGSSEGGRFGSWKDLLALKLSGSEDPTLVTDNFHSFVDYFMET